MEDLNWKNNPRSLKNESKGPDGFNVYYKIPGSKEDERGYFAFIKTVYDFKFDPEEENNDNGDSNFIERCDAYVSEKYPKPTALHEVDIDTGLCALCGSSDPIYPTTNSHVASLKNTRVLRLPIQGYKGFIVYLRLNSKELEDADFNYSDNLGKTLPELFRLMLEWEWCYLQLGTRDTYSVLAYEILHELELPQEIRDWLWSEVPEQRVAKFLKGDTEARKRSDISTIPLMSPEFDSWCWYNIVDKPAIWKNGAR